MKLLFDQNISYRIVNKLDDTFECAQIRSLNMDGASDTDIWQYAKDNGFMIVTFDADFYDLAAMQGIPPKIIWLHFGNTSTQKLADILSNKQADIHAFYEDTDSICLEVH